LISSASPSARTAMSSESSIGFAFLYRSVRVKWP